MNPWKGTPSRPDSIQFKVDICIPSQGRLLHGLEKLFPPGKTYRFQAEHREALL